MSRKDYEIIAAALAEAKAQAMTPDELSGVFIAAALLSRTLAEANPRFDRQRFLTACGM